MDRNALMEMAHSDPRFAQGIDMMEQQIAQMPVMPEDLDEIIKMLEFVLQNPDKYPEVRQAAIADGVVTEDQAPPEFDQVFIISLLVALYGLQERMMQRPQGQPEMMGQPPAFARGGLNHVAAMGRGGDTMLAHINPREAEVLRRMGGSGTINPHTGLTEYKSGKGLLGAILPIALNFFVPGLGVAIGSALGASATFAPMLGSAFIGGASSALGGGNVLQGALMGGISGGLGGATGSAVNESLGLGLSKGAESMIGSSLLGGAAGLATGKGFVGGAVQGALGQMAGDKLGGLDGSLGAAGRQFSNALTAGYDPKTAALTGLAAGMSNSFAAKQPTGTGTGLKSPSDAVVGTLKTPLPYDGIDSATGKVNYDLVSPPGMGIGETGLKLPSTSGQPAPSPLTSVGKAIGNMDMGQMLAVASMANSLNSAPPEVKQAVQTMSPERQEYFNRPSVAFDWQRMQQEANGSNKSLSQYMAENWPSISGGAYNKPQLARGGALSKVAYLAKGAGSGRDDTIDARLSDGEYVMDAETVALLGDGSTKQGAQRLDAMREQLRRQKGKALAKGKFSPNAKSPLAYLRGVA